MDHRAASPHATWPAMKGKGRSSRSKCRIRAASARAGRKRMPDTEGVAETTVSAGGYAVHRKQHAMHRARTQAVGAKPRTWDTRSARRAMRMAYTNDVRLMRRYAPVQHVSRQA